MLEPRYGRNQGPHDHSNNPIYTHSRTRTTSSNTFPDQIQVQHPPPSGYRPQMHMHLVTPQGLHQRRSPSVNTFSTISSAGPPPSAYRTSPTTDLRRSTSSRSASGGAPGSPMSNNYVSLLRRQKATSWCDRTQYDDPRLQAQQRAAKMRANLDVVGQHGGGGGGGGSGGGVLGLGSGGASGGRTATGLSSAGGKVAAKIRHHGKPAVVGYAPDNHYVGVTGVPLRLSATEVEGEDSDEDDVAAAAQHRLHHRRTGSSGRSSTASGRRGLAYRSSGGLGPINSQGSGGSSGGRRWSPGDTPERTGSLVGGGKEELTLAGDDSSGRARSVGSGSSKERLDSVPDLGGNGPRLAGNSLMNSAIAREKSVKNPEDLKRRGSVDERTMTLTSGRLFIANPD